MSLRRMILPTAAPAKALIECTECGKCCTYVAVEVNPPTRPKYATDILWFLYHENVTIYIDGDGDWSVVFETRCRNLQETKLCGIYPQRPHVCRAFDNRSCEVNDPTNGMNINSPAEFLAYLQEKKPKIYAKVAETFMPEALRPTPLAPATPARRRRPSLARRPL